MDDNSWKVVTERTVQAICARPAFIRIFDVTGMSTMRNIMVNFSCCRRRRDMRGTSVRVRSQAGEGPMK